MRTPIAEAEPLAASGPPRAHAARGCRSARSPLVSPFVSVLVSVLVSVSAPCRADWAPPEPLEDGWSGSVEFGGQSLGGNARSRSLSGALDVTWASGRLESELAVEVLASTVSLVVPRRDADGELVRDEDGRTLLDVTRARAHERLTATVRGRWFWTPRAYQFALLERERDAPVGTDRFERLASGAGYKLWRSEEDFIAAELGVGRKRLDYTDGERPRGAIGYAALRAVRRLGERLRLEGGLDADFAGDDPYAAARLGLRLRVSERVSLKLRHTERHNTQESSPTNPFDSRRDTLTTISLGIALF